MISKLRLGGDEMSVEIYIQMEGEEITELEMISAQNPHPWFCPSPGGCFRTDTPIPFYPLHTLQSITKSSVR